MDSEPLKGYFCIWEILSCPLRGRTAKSVPMIVARCEGSVCKRDPFEADHGTDLKNVLLLPVH